jgi:hypothetical protein
MFEKILPYAIWAFSLLMVVHCVRQRAGFLWVVLILLAQPYGGIAYLVYVNLIERQRGRQGMAGGARAREVDADDAVRASPGTHAERALDVADTLEEQGRYGEAALVFRRAIEHHRDNPRAVHGLARCLMELEEVDEALQKYELLMEIDPRYRNYAAALEYAEALHRQRRTDDATGLLDGLVKETGRLNHRLALAHYLEAGGQQARARNVLSDALAAFESAPAPEQAANRRWQRLIEERLTAMGGSPT